MDFCDSIGRCHDYIFMQKKKHIKLTPGKVLFKMKNKQNAIKASN